MQYSPFASFSVESPRPVVAIGHHLIKGSDEVSEPGVLVSGVVSHVPGGGMVPGRMTHGLQVTHRVRLDSINVAHLPQSLSWSSHTIQIHETRTPCGEAIAAVLESKPESNLTRKSHLISTRDESEGLTAISLIIELCWCLLSDVERVRSTEQS